MRPCSSKRLSNRPKPEAEKRLAEITAGSALSDVAGSYAVTGPLSVDRNDRQIPPGLSSALFRTAKPGAGGSTPGSAKLAGGDFAIYLLTGVTEGVVDAETNQQQLDSLRRMLARDHYEMVLNDLESRADVEILLNTESE